MKDETDDTESSPRGRKRYDARRVRKLICMNSRFEAVGSEIGAFKAEADRTDSLLVAIGDRYAAGRTQTRDDAVMIRWADRGLVGYRQLALMLATLNDELAQALAQPSA